MLIEVNRIRAGTTILLFFMSINIPSLRLCLQGTLLIGAAFRILLIMFGIFGDRRRRPDIDDINPEQWSSSFRLFDQKRFSEYQDQNYGTELTRAGYTLQIAKPHCFAWGDNPWYRYEDFVLEAEIAFDPANGHSAAGFLFRKIGDQHYYYFLVSNNGHFRFDLVRNEEPLVLVGWTACPEPVENCVSLRIIARGPSFLFMINDQWVAVFSDDTITAGKIAFGAQNYGEDRKAAFSLRKIRVNSIPLQIEQEYEDWVSRVKPARDARFRLAETLYSQGQYAAAAVQIKKIVNTESPRDSDYFLLGECCVKLGMYPEALVAIEKTLEYNPQMTDARLEKANILYLSGNYLELRVYVARLVEDFPQNSLCWNMKGHAEYYLGNWLEAATAYAKAVEYSPDMPLYRINHANSLEKCTRQDEALSEYLQSATLMFRQEAYADLEDLVPVIERLDNGNMEVRSFHAKVAFYRGDYFNAAVLFKDILDNDCLDSSVFYLYALCLLMEKQRDQATEYLYRAIEIEPGFYLYWFRLAENLYLSGLDAREEIIKALELHPEEPWVLNLAGQILMGSGDYQAACQYLAKALQLASEEQDIAINYSQALSYSGDYQKAEDVLACFPESAAVNNQYGNILVSRQRYNEAIARYEKAHAMDPKNADILFNLGAACLETDQIIRAEESIGRAMEVDPQAHIYLKMAEIARIKREYYRSEVILEEAVRAYPEHPQLWQEYLLILCVRNRLDTALALLNDPDSPLARLKERDSIYRLVSRRYPQLMQS